MSRKPRFHVEPTPDEIAAHIAEHGVTECPPAAAAVLGVSTPGWRHAVDSRFMASSEPHDGRSNLDDAQARFLLRRLDEARAERDLADKANQQTEESLTARLGEAHREVQQHKAKVSELAVKLSEARARLEARQTELIEANNREVERRRTAESERDAAIEDLRTQLRAGDVLLAANNREVRRRREAEAERDELRAQAELCAVAYRDGGEDECVVACIAVAEYVAKRAQTVLDDHPLYEVQHHAGNPHTPEWQIRVIEERAALNAKIVALTSFVFRNDPAFGALPDQDKALLRAQRSAMIDYSAILAHRIARFDNAEILPAEAHHAPQG